MTFVTFDKFQILKIINAGVDKVRREEVKDNPILKGACNGLTILNTKIAS
jgi:hypothetical protein